MIATESWSDVSPLPTIESAPADLYLRFAAQTTAERARDALRAKGYTPQARETLYVLCVQNVDPLPPLRTVVGLLSPPEMAETLALLKPPGADVQAVDVVLAIRASRLRDRLAGRWLIDILRSQDLTVLFQPVFRADDRRSVYGYEALARGHLNGETILPARMIEVAENGHLMAQFDALAMQKALTEAARAKIEGTIFLNCAPGHIYDPPTRMSEIAQLCKQLGLRPEQVVLEIVETEKNDPGHLQNLIRACRLQHVRVALDDLGAGYSSLNLLADLHPDIVKLDRSLVTSINTDAYRALIVNRILDAARILGISTIVEGIETEAELDWAKANGAAYVQGNLLGEPAPL